MNTPSEILLLVLFVAMLALMTSCTNVRDCVPDPEFGGYTCQLNWSLTQ